MTYFILGLIAATSVVWLAFEIHPALGVLVISLSLIGLKVLYSLAKNVIEEQERKEEVDAAVQKMAAEARADRDKALKSDPARFMPPGDRKSG